MKDELTKEQLARLIKHMHTYPDDPWDEHARWAETELKVVMTEKECCELYMSDCLKIANSATT